MKTAEDILKENFELEDWSSGFRSDIVDCMKEYAKEVAKDALNRSYENSEASIEYDYQYPFVIINKESIINTEIITP